MRKEPRKRTSVISIIMLGLLSFGTTGLAIALAVVATRRPRIVVVPGVKDRQVLLPEEVPDSAVRKFGILYLYHLDNYTPKTVEARSNYVLRFVSPEFLEDAVRSLTQRGNSVLRTKESSQLVLPLPEECGVKRTKDGRLRFSAVAVRKVYIAGELKRTEGVRYLVEMRPVLPTQGNVYGFVVVGQSIRPVEKGAGS